MPLIERGIAKQTSNAARSCDRAALPFIRGGDSKMKNLFS
jgi:hypothetical protein